jgi:predicted RND superfamily exporter protein
MLPLVLAAAQWVGAIPVFGVTLNPIGRSIGAIVIGQGIDYSIHIIEGLDEERLSSGLEHREAAWKALATMGPHLLAGMLTTSVRFGAS